MTDCQHRTTLGYLPLAKASPCLDGLHGISVNGDCATAIAQ